MSAHVMALCLACAEHSDADISVEDGYDWQREHLADADHTPRFLLVADGVEYRLTEREVAGFKVGQRVSIVDENALWAAGPGPHDFTITAFAVYGYQGIVATDANQAAYVDHLSPA